MPVEAEPRRQPEFQTYEVFVRYTSEDTPEVNAFKRLIVTKDDLAGETTEAAIGIKLAKLAIEDGLSLQDPVLRKRGLNAIGITGMSQVSENMTKYVALDDIRSQLMISFIEYLRQVAEQHNSDNESSTLAS